MLDHNKFYLTIYNTYPPAPEHSSYGSATRSFYTTKELAVSSTPYDPATDKSTGTNLYYGWKQYR